MKKTYVLLSIAIVLFIAPAVSFSKSPVQIDVLFMDHGPMQPTLRKLRALFPAYRGQVVVSWHNFESDEGGRFKSKMGIRHHTPLVIWIDGKTQFISDDHTVKFEGFPTGSGPSSFQGQWTVEDLANVLDRITGKN